jgi:hypothetical protein
MTLALLLPGLAKKPADRKKWSRQFLASQDQLLVATHAFKHVTKTG